MDTGLDFIISQLRIITAKMLNLWDLTHYLPLMYILKMSSKQAKDCTRMTRYEGEN